jgi:N-acetylneuraminic acid mutarotase
MDDRRDISARLDRRGLLLSAAGLGAAALAACGGSEGAAVRVLGGPPQAVALGSWRERARLPGGRADAAVVAHRDRVHVLGGATRTAWAVAAHETYDARADAWRVLAPLPRPLRGAGAAAGHGRIYVAGGLDDGRRAVGDVFVYDRDADAWDALAPLPVASAAPALAVVEELLVAVAGRRAWTLRTNDPAARWTEGARVEAGRSSPGVVALANVVHVIGGREGRLPSNRHDVYNPWQDAWFGLAPLPTARSSAAAAVLGGQAVIAGGIGWDGLTGRTEAYDRRTDMWTALAPLPVARRGAGAAVVGRTLHVAGGGGRRPGARHDAFTRSPA